MINISTERTSKGITVNAEFVIKGTNQEAIEEFAAVIEALRKADETYYSFAAIVDAERAKKEAEHDGKE